MLHNTYNSALRLPGGVVRRRRRRGGAPPGRGDGAARATHGGGGGGGGEAPRGQEGVQGAHADGRGGDGGDGAEGGGLPVGLDGLVVWPLAEADLVGGGAQHGHQGREGTEKKRSAAANIRTCFSICGNLVTTFSIPTPTGKVTESHSFSVVCISLVQDSLDLCDPQWDSDEEEPEEVEYYYKSILFFSISLSLLRYHRPSTYLPTCNIAS